MGYLGLLVMMMSIGLLVGGGMGDEVSLTDLAKAGAFIFSMISYGQVILICLLAPLFMAGAMAQEKVGQAYDILLTTPLTNLQIVLGALLGRLFFVWTLLLSGLPLFAILLIFGGIPVGAVFTSFWVAAIAALVMGAVAMTLSVCRTSGRKAVYIFVIVIATYLVACYTLDVFMLRRLASMHGSGSGSTTWLTPLHPMLVLEASLSQAGYRPPDINLLKSHSFLKKIYLGRPLVAFSVLMVSLSGILILVSTWLLRWVGSVSGVSGKWGWGARLLVGQRRLTGQGESRRAARRVWTNPIAWREAQARRNRMAWVLGRLSMVVTSVSAVLITLWLYHCGAMPKMPDPIHGGVLKPHQGFRLMLQALLLIEMAMAVLVAIYLSAVCVSREREDGTLDLILATPLTARQYIWGKLRGLVNFLSLLLIAPILTLMVVSVYTFVGTKMGWSPAVVSQMVLNRNGPPTVLNVGLVLLESPLLLLFMLVPFSALCVMVGMSWSLRAAGVLSAVSPAVGIIGCLVMVTGFCGYNAAQSVPFVGPVLNAFSPVTNVLVLVDPWSHVAGFSEDPVFGRISLAIGALVAGGCYSLIVYLMLLTMVKDFDHTVRRLSGVG